MSCIPFPGVSPCCAHGTCITNTSTFNNISSCTCDPGWISNGDFVMINSAGCAMNRDLVRYLYVSLVMLTLCVVLPVGFLVQYALYATKAYQRTAEKRLVWTYLVDNLCKCVWSICRFVTPDAGVGTSVLVTVTYALQGVTLSFFMAATMDTFTVRTMRRNEHNTKLYGDVLFFRTRVIPAIFFVQILLVSGTPLMTLTATSSEAFYGWVTAYYIGARIGFAILLVIFRQFCVLRILAALPRNADGGGHRARVEAMLVAIGYAAMWLMIISPIMAFWLTPLASYELVISFVFNIPPICIVPFVLLSKQDLKRTPRFVQVFVMWVRREKSDQSSMMSKEMEPKLRAKSNKAHISHRVTSVPRNGTVATTGVGGGGFGGSVASFTSHLDNDGLLAVGEGWEGATQYEAQMAAGGSQVQWVRKMEE